MKQKNLVVSIGAAMAVILVGGCTSTVGLSGTSEEATNSGVKATVDRTTASISLPLDRYVMSDEEKRLVSAAQEIVFMTCATSTDVADATVVEEARQILTQQGGSPDWLYGYWDAAYISENGLEGTETSADQGDDAGIDPTKGRECVQGQAYIDLTPIDPDLVSFDTASDQLRAAYGDAFSRTTADLAFISLVDARSACLEREGFTVSNSGSFDAVFLPKGADDEQILRSALAEAQCSDEVGLVTRAADINALYQQSYIDGHQAELTALRQLGDERVAAATRVLQDAGVM